MYYSSNFVVSFCDVIQIRLNQGVSGDNQATPPAPELIPPLTVIAPWCFKVCTRVT